MSRQMQIGRIIILLGFLAAVILTMTGCNGYRKLIGNEQPEEQPRPEYLQFPGGSGLSQDSVIGTRHLEWRVDDMKPDFLALVAGNEGNNSLVPYTLATLTGTRKGNSRVTAHTKGSGFVYKVTNSNGDVVVDPACPGYVVPTPPGQCHYVAQPTVCEFEYDFIGSIDANRHAVYTYTGVRCGVPISGTLTLN